MLKMIFLAASLLSAASAEAVEITLNNADFEQSIVGNRIPGWSRTQHAGVRAYEITNDLETFAHGKQSIRMLRTVEQAYGLILQQVQTDAVSGKEVELVASLKTAKVGEKGWVMLLNFMHHNTVIDQFRAAPVVGDSDWSKVTIRKLAPPNTTAIEVGFMLLDGGTGWVDNVHVRSIDADTKAKPDSAVSRDAKTPAKPGPVTPKSRNGVGKSGSPIPKVGKKNA